MSTQRPPNSFDGIRANAAKERDSWDKIDANTAALFATDEKTLREKYASTRAKLQKTIAADLNSRPSPLTTPPEENEPTKPVTPTSLFEKALSGEHVRNPTTDNTQEWLSTEQLSEMTKRLQMLEDSLLASKVADEEASTTMTDTLDHEVTSTLVDTLITGGDELPVKNRRIHESDLNTTDGVLNAIAEDVEIGVQKINSAATSPVPFEIGGVPLERTTSPQEIDTAPAEVETTPATISATIPQQIEQSPSVRLIPTLPKESIVTMDQINNSPTLHQRIVVRGGLFHSGKKYGTGLVKKIKTFFQSKKQEVTYDSKTELAEAAYKVAEENQRRHAEKLATEKAFKQDSLANPDIDLTIPENERVAKLEEQKHKEHTRELADAAYAAATLNQERHKLHLEKLALQKAPELKKTEVKRANIFKRLLSKKARNDFDRADYKKIGGKGYDDFLEEVAANSYFDIADRKNRNDPESSMTGVTTSELDVLHKEYTDHKEAEAKKVQLEKDRLEAEEKQKKLNRTDEQKIADWLEKAEVRKGKGFFASTKNILKKGSDKLFGFPTDETPKESRKEQQARVDKELGDDYEAIIEKDAFSHLNTPVINNLERTKKENSIQKGLRKILLNTKEKSMEVRRKLGPEGLKFLNTLDRGAEFFDSNVSKKTRLFAGATLAATGALALYATPAIGTVAVISAAGIGVRVVAASASYIAIKRVLDAQTKKFGATEKKLFALAGAAVAAMLGELAGRYLAPTVGEALQEYLPQINETIFTVSRDAVAPSSVPSNIIDVTTPTPEITQVLAPEISPVPTIVPEATIPATVIAPPVTESLTSSISPELLQHTVAPGENIWNILKETMKASNYEGFAGLSEDMKQQKILDMVGKIMENPKVVGLHGDNINLIHPGEKLDFTKLFEK